MRFKSITLLGLALLFLSGCTCCLYLNHYYNAEKYFDKAVALKKERLELNPQDSLWVNKPEQEALNKSIEKCSAILERWPTEVDYKPDVLFLMGEAFLKLGKWVQAIQKYDEYLKYFPEGEHKPTVDFHKAMALAKSGQASLAKYALQDIIKDPKHPWHSQALTLLATLQLGNDNPQEAIASLEALLKIPNGNPRIRAQALYQLGQLYYQEKQYTLSRERYRNPEIEILGNQMLYQALKKGAISINEHQDYATAISDLKGILQEKRFETHQIEVEMLLARALIQNQEFNQGLALFNKLKLEYPNTEVAAEAYYWHGEYFEFFPQDYPNAVLRYDSAVTASPKTPYGIKSLAKVNSLKQLVAWQDNRSKGKVSATENFKIAELFLFDLNQTDSALVILDSIIAQSTTRPELQVRAAYARAFITDEFKDDPKRTEELYQYVIDKFPNSQYAQQAQRNLGLEVTIQTNEDKARALFVKAEDKYDQLQLQSNIEPTLFDSLELEALAQFDSIITQYPETDEAARALYFKAYIYENQHFDKDKARVTYQQLAKDYYATPWGVKAHEKLNGKIILDDKRMQSIRSSYERTIRDFERRATQMEGRRKAEAEQKAEQEKEEEEQLLWDYNDMYDIGQ